MNISLPIKSLLLACLLSISFTSRAQMPVCNLIYGRVAGSIYNYNPALAVSSTNPAVNTIAVPTGTYYGLTVSPVLGSSSTTNTFYLIDYATNEYLYYNNTSTSWINTGHKAGNTAAVNIAAGGGYIYSLVGGTGAVYKYDGTGDGTLLVTVPGFSGVGPYDLVADCEGNWYIFNQTGSSPFLKKYSPAGMLLKTWVVSNPLGLSVSAGAGFAIIGSTLYTDNYSGSGDIASFELGADTVKLLSTTSIGTSFSDDLGSCSGAIPIIPTATISASTNNVCSDTPISVNYSLVTSSAGSSPSFVWKVNGATVGTGSSLTYTVSNNDTVVCQLTSSSPCATTPTVLSNKIIMKVDATPSAPGVTTPVIYCQGQTASALTATVSSGTNTLYWYSLPSGGGGSATAPVPSTSTVGSTNYYVSQRTALGCEGARSTLAVQVNRTPAAPSAPSPVAYCKDATAVALTATKPDPTDTLLWYTGPSGGTGSASAIIPSTASVGSVTYYVSAKSALNCEGPRTPITVQVNRVPAAPAATSPVVYCQNAASVALTATKPDPTDTLLWYTAASGGTGSKTAITPATTSAGSVIYYVSAKSSNNCEGPRTPITVQVNRTPAAPAVTGMVSFCQNTTPVDLTATKPDATDTLYWYTLASGGTGSTTAIAPPTGTAGSTTYYVSAKSAAGCEGSRSAITVQVNRTPAAPAVPAATVVYCQNTTPVALSATKPDVTDTLLWYTTATGGTGSRTAITPSTTTTGTSTFYVSAKSALNCEGPRTAITVTVNPTPTAPVVVTPVVYCQGDASAPLSATKLLASDTVLWYTVATGGTASKLTITPNTATAGSTTHYVSLKNAFGCEGPRSSISVTINPTPGAPSATTSIVYCQGATASALSAVLAAPADSLIWYTVATGGTGSKTAPTPSTSATGTTTYYVSGKTTLNCEGPRTAITVTVNPTPAAPSATTTISYCQNATAVPLTATKASTTDTLYWYTVATGGTGSTTAPIPSTTTAGTFNFYVSAKNTSKCEGPRTNIVVTIKATPAAPVVTSPVNLCLGGSSSALTATGSGLLWYTSAAGGSGSATAPTPSTSIASTITHYVSQTVSGCEGPRSSITVTVNNLPAAPTVTTPVIYCQNATATALTAPKGTTDTLIWYTVASGGTGSKTAPVPSTTTTGSTTNYVSVRSQYQCEGGRSAIVVTVNPTPAAPTVTSPVTYCKDATAVALIATKSTATDTLKWYAVSSGGTASLSAPVPSTANAGSFSAYVSQTNTFKCESPRAMIAITINPLPATPGITTPVNLCLGGPSAALTATGTAIKWYTAATGGTGSSTAPTPSTATTGTTTYYVTQTESVNSCESPRAALNVIVNALPAAPGVATPLNLCIGSTAVPLTAVGTSLKWYTAATGGTGSTTAPTPPTAALGSTMYYVSQTSSVGCEGPRAPFEVAVQALPVVSISPVGVPGFFYCDGKTIRLKATSPTATTYQWYFGSALISGATKDTMSTGTTGNYKVQVANIYGCKAEVTVFVQKDTTAFPILTPAAVSICEESSTLLNVHPAYTGFTFDWYKDGVPAVPATPKSSNKSVNLTGTYKVTVTNLYGCINTTNDAIVSYYPRPVKPTVVRVDPTLSLRPSTYRYYQWYRNGSKIFGATGPTHTFSLDGSYYAQITDSNGCLNNSDTININGLSIGSSKVNKANIKVYPNPTRNTVNIEAPFAINIQVLDMVGKIVLEQKEVTSINLEPFADGTYMLRIFDTNRQLLGVERINKVSN